MKENYTHIAVVLDSSGSMGMIFDDTVAGFNHFLKAQKEAEGEATLTLVEFAQPMFEGHTPPLAPQFPYWNHTNLPIGAPVPPVGTPAINVKLDFQPIKAVPQLSKKNYRPSGGTPLLDTIGETIIRTGQCLSALPESLRPSKVLFVIITDGEENASRYYNFDKIKELTNHQSIVYKWEFMYLGANQDAIKVGSNLGIGANRSMSYGLSAADIGSTYSAVATKTASFRSAVGVDQINAALNFTEEERKSAKSK